MNMTEFEERITRHNLGMAVNGSLYPNQLCIYDKTSQQTVAIISMDEVAIMNTGYNQFNAYPTYKCKDLLNLFFQFAITPLGEREPIDQYVYILESARDTTRYIAYNPDFGTIIFSPNPWKSSSKWKFTTEDIVSYPEDVQGIFASLKQLPLQSINTRAEVEG